MAGDQASLRARLQQALDANGRYTQDVPVQANVWLSFGDLPRDGRLALLLTPTCDTTAARLAATLTARLPSRKRGVNAPIHVPGLILAELSLAELITVALPLTRWRDRLARMDESRRQATLDHLTEIVALLPGGDDFAEAIITLGQPADIEGQEGRQQAVPEPRLERVALGRCFDLADGPAPGDALRTIKADAADRVFGLKCDGLRWAIIDSGINASVGAFGLPDKPVDALSAADWKGCRIDAAYDFSQLTDWLRLAQLSGPPHHRLTASIADTLGRRDPGAQPAEIVRKATELARHLVIRWQAHRDIDWEMLEPVLEVAVTEPPRSGTDGGSHGHGTAVAGLLAADGSVAGVRGVCPDLHLIDIRVLAVENLPEHDPATARQMIREFDLVAALQFLRFLNARNERMYVHGVNLSIQTPHDVTNYGCGATLICDEVNRAVASGIVVVVAAGNDGYRTIADVNGRHVAHYFGMTITDPGNAEEAITVGSTHRRDPYRYGVSYFSGRGPTGDGRRKPDLIAPGEKITVLSATGGALEDRDGTSFAAPQVSGAAALLMARYPELIGEPRRIKRILMDSACDLGRDPNFQGAGLLDILRALQSV